MPGDALTPTPFPEWVEPMAATLTQERFSGPEWIFERKLDGIRLLAFKRGSDARLLSMPWERAAREEWEGVIAKRRGSRYEHRRSPHWLKMKCEATQELVVGGFTDPQRRRVGLGALLVGYFDGEDFVFAGRVGTGFDTKLLLSLRARLDALEVAEPPFTQGLGLPRLGAHWVRPEIVVQVAFLEWTVHGKLRHSRLLSLRSDKLPREVVRETT